jgi:outer membrane lipoprotein-sorting protein
MPWSFATAFVIYGDSMVRKFLVAVMILLTVACIIGLFIKVPSDPPAGTLADRKTQFSPIPEGPTKPIELPGIVKEINARNAQIKSLSCDKVSFQVWQSGHRFKLSGNLYYEKPKGFRMQIDSILGREVDVGSNDKEFWYWSRRDKQPGLHFAKHEDIDKTRLKAPFNPMFLRATLGFETMPSENVKIIENPTDIMLVYPRKSPTGQPLLFSIFVSKERKQVDGYVVTNPSGKNVAACEIQQYTGDIPVKILYSWYEEDRAMLMIFSGPKLNSPISPVMWAMPDYKPKLNMADD